MEINQIETREGFDLERKTGGADMEMADMAVEWSKPLPALDMLPL